MFHSPTSAHSDRGLCPGRDEAMTLKRTVECLAITDMLPRFRCSVFQHKLLLCIGRCPGVRRLAPEPTTGVITDCRPPPDLILRSPLPIARLFLGCRPSCPGIGPALLHTHLVSSSGALTLPQLFKVSTRAEANVSCRA